MDRIWIGVVLALILAACGGRTLTVPEYAAEVEELVTEMSARFATADAGWESEAPSVEGAQRYWDRRLEIRDDFLAGVESLDPPEELVLTHDEAVDIFRRITAADYAIAAQVADYDTVTEHWPWVDTPEGQASDAILEEVYAFCRRSQEDFDATRERGALEGVPWLPPEMQEAVKVAFGCPPSAALVED